MSDTIVIVEPAFFAAQNPHGNTVAPTVLALIVVDFDQLSPLLTVPYSAQTVASDISRRVRQISKIEAFEQAFPAYVEIGLCGVCQSVEQAQTHAGNIVAYFPFRINIPSPSR